MCVCILVLGGTSGAQTAQPRTVTCTLPLIFTLITIAHPPTAHTRYTHKHKLSRLLSHPHSPYLFSGGSSGAQKARRRTLAHTLILTHTHYLSLTHAHTLSRPSYQHSCSHLF